MSQSEEPKIKENNTAEDYSAKSINVLKVNYLRAIRGEFNISQFKTLERGEHIRLTKEFNIPRVTITRAVNESKILSFFPNLQKSKCEVLSTLRSNKELLIFSKRYDIYNLSVRKLKDLVKEWRIEIEKNPNIVLSELQNDLIIGSTIGDANIRQREKNCSFRIGHSPKQKRYLEYKYEILKEFENSGIKLSQREINGRLANTFNVDFDTHYVFNYYRKLFYNKSGIKVIKKEALNFINPRSLAFWLCDDGSYCKKLKYLIFCTNSFSYEEHLIMKKYFEDIWGLSPTVGFRDKKYYYLRFKVDDTKKLVEIVRPFIIKSMKYKIGEENE